MGTQPCAETRAGEAVAVAVGANRPRCRCGAADNGGRGLAVPRTGPRLAARRAVGGGDEDPGVGAVVGRVPSRAAGPGSRTADHRSHPRRSTERAIVGGSGGPHCEAAPGCDPHVRRLARRQPGPADEPCGRGAGGRSTSSRRARRRSCPPAEARKLLDTIDTDTLARLRALPGIREHHELLESRSASLVPAVRGADRGSLPAGELVAPTCSGSLAMSD